MCHEALTKFTATLQPSGPVTELADVWAYVKTLKESPPASSIELLKAE